MATQAPDRTIERRVVTGDVRAEAGESGPTQLAGYAAVFNRETVIQGWGEFREVILPGAFDAALAKDDVLALWNHDPDVVLGRSGNGTVRLTTDETGLHYAVDVNRDDPQAVGVAARVARGDVHTSSFAFSVEDGGDEWDNSGRKEGLLPLRKIKTVARLYDVSPVAAAAYPQTSVSARAESCANELAGAAEPPAPRTYSADPATRRRELALRRQ